MTTSNGSVGFPSQLAQNPAYSASNVLQWIKLEQFHDYLVYKSENTVQITMSSTQPDVNAHRIVDNPPFGGHDLPHKPQSVAISQSFHPPLPLYGPIFVEAHPCPTPIPAPVVVKSVLHDIIKLAAPAPAPRKRQRQEVDLENMIDELRAGKTGPPDEPRRTMATSSVYLHLLNQTRCSLRCHAWSNTVLCPISPLHLDIPLKYRDRVISEICRTHVTKSSGFPEVYEAVG
ncbi:hypothetical protein C8J57DRAFT_1475143 [Mycena rebaudengoi]|nr:hypothetical protein C8J57DRAFT_1475143 [Mycena rebaudengoi]